MESSLTEMFLCMQIPSLFAFAAWIGQFARRAPSTRKMVNNVHSFASKALVRGFNDARARVMDAAKQSLEKPEKRPAKQMPQGPAKSENQKTPLAEMDSDVRAWVFEMNHDDGAELLSGCMAEFLEVTRQKWLKHPPDDLSLYPDAEMIVRFIQESAPWATLGVGGAFVRRAAIGLFAA